MRHFPTCIPFLFIYLFLIYFTLFYFWPRRVACGVLVPRPGIKTGPSAVRARSPNHWTAREVPQRVFLFVCLFYFFIFYFLFYFLKLLAPLFIYLFIYLVVLGLRFCARTFSSCGKRGPLFIAVRGPLTIVASLVAEHRLQTCRLSNCGSQA